jgi:hypothetical protein
MIDADDARTNRMSPKRIFGAAEQLHHSFEDPAAFLGLSRSRLAVFRRVRDELRAYLANLAQRVA